MRSVFLPASFLPMLWWTRKYLSALRCAQTASLWVRRAGDGFVKGISRNAMGNVSRSRHPDSETLLSCRSKAMLQFWWSNNYDNRLQSDRPPKQQKDSQWVRFWCLIRPSPWYGKTFVSLWSPPDTWNTTNNGMGRSQAAKWQLVQTISQMKEMTYFFLRVKSHYGQLIMPMVKVREIIILRVEERGRFVLESGIGFDVADVFPNVSQRGFHTR